MTQIRRLFRSEVRNVLLLSAAFLGVTAGAQSIGPSATTPATSQQSPKTQAVPGTAAPAAAAQATPFDKLDANQDGRLSAVEAEKHPKVVRQFNQLDTNHDGFLSRGEFRSAPTS